MWNLKGINEIISSDTTTIEVDLEVLYNGLKYLRVIGVHTDLFNRTA